MRARVIGGALAVLGINGAYIAAFPQASVFYMANVLLHLVLGLGLMVAAVFAARRYPRESGAFLLAGLPALYLGVRGNTLDHRWALWLHVLLASTAVLLIGMTLWRRVPSLRTGFAGLVALLILLPAGSELYRRVHPNPDHRIENPRLVPVSMDEEGAGAHSPFAPSSAQTNTGRIIPSNFFMDSETCGECHKDIYQ